MRETGYRRNMRLEKKKSNRDDITVKDVKKKQTKSIYVRYRAYISNVQSVYMNRTNCIYGPYKAYICTV